MSRLCSDSQVAKALQDYAKVNSSGDYAYTTKQIADKYGVCPATITVWARNANIILRSRGRHKLEAPSERQKEILDRASIMSYKSAGKPFGLSKARVGKIAQRWKNWLKPKKPPFQPGDIILWRGEKLTVIDAGIHSGTLIDKQGNKLRCFTWVSGGRLPKKVGVNKKYVVKLC